MIDTYPAGASARHGIAVRARFLATFIAALPLLFSLCLPAQPVAGRTPLARSTNPHVRYDRASLLIDGGRVFLAAGEFEYWRLPSPRLWPEIMARMRAAGLNTLSVYIPWAYHSPAQNTYDFTGIRDLDRFLDDARRAGLYVIARPGPFVDAESNGGQIPGWLFASRAPFRTADPAYIAAVAQWYDRVLPIIARHQIGEGGSVIMVQIENELIHGDPEYMRALARIARADGIDVPLLHNDSPLPGDKWSIGMYASIVDISAPDNYPGGFDCRKPWSNADMRRDVDGFEAMFRARPEEAKIPFLVAEYQGGSFDPYGGPGYQACYDKLGPEFTDVAFKSLIAQGVSGITQYMFYGGTTWGYMANSLVYSSYDYGSPIREWFELGPRYDATKRLNYFLEATAGEITDTEPDLEAVRSTNASVWTRGRVNPGTGAAFLFVRNENETAAQTTRLEIKTRGGSYTIPSRGELRLPVHGMKLLLANSRRPWGTLDYSTSELLTEAASGGLSTVVLWGDTNEEGETRLVLPEDGMKLTSSPGIAARQAGRVVTMNYTHRPELQYLRCEGNGKTLVVAIADRAGAGRFWRVRQGDADTLVYGGYLVSPSDAGGFEIRTLGDDSITVFGRGVLQNGQIQNGQERVLLDGAAVPVEADALSSSLRFSLKRRPAATIAPPALDHWSFTPEPFEAAPGYDDSRWPVADANHGLNPDAHDFSYGFVWHRGRFVPTADARFLRLQVYDSSTVWLNGQLLGSADGGAVQTFELTPGLLHPGETNTLAVLAEGTGRARNVEPFGIVQADLLAEREPLETIHVDPMKAEDAKGLRLTPGWSEGSDNFFNDVTLKTATVAGARLTFRFHGPLLRILGPYAADRGQADVLIDGRKAGEIDASRPPTLGSEAPLFERIGLDDKEHTGEIVVTGQRHAGAKGPRLSIAAIETGPVASAGLPIDIDWRLSGADGEVRTGLASPFNGSGLYGELHGWSSNGGGPAGRPVTLPSTFDGAGEWVGWYRTTFTLDAPPGSETEWGFEFDGVDHEDDKAMLYVNGLLYGRYWPAKGPERRFFIPRGVWRPGANTIAIAVWRRGKGPGTLGKVELTPFLHTEIWKARIEDPSSAK